MCARWTAPSDVTRSYSPSTLLARLRRGWFGEAGGTRGQVKLGPRLHWDGAEAAASKTGLISIFPPHTKHVNTRLVVVDAVVGIRVSRTALGLADSLLAWLVGNGGDGKTAHHGTTTLG